MITDYNYFSNSLSEIDREIDLLNQDVDLIKRLSIHDYSKESVSQKFNEIFRVFPYIIETTSESIGISIYARELFELFDEISVIDGKIKDERIAESKYNFKNYKFEASDRHVIHTYLCDYFYSITYCYGEIFENTKKYHFFYGIESEEVILTNLLKLYNSVLLEDSKQLCIFNGITVTKKISDIVTKMLIDFIEQRLMVLNPKFELENIPNKMTFVNNKLKPIEWLGTQQELCELFLELEKKKWIPEIGIGERRSIANSITSIFDLDSTKRKENSNYKESFYQKFKGELMEGQRYFSFLESEKDKLRFNEIKNNP